MTTTPFSADLVARLKRATAWKFSGVISEERFTPRFFCCTDPNDLGLDPGKQPVAVIDLTPNPVFVGDTVSFDGTDSYDPDGSIVSYAWTFEGQTPATSSSDSGSFSAAGPGIYTVQLTVTDGTGLVSPPARVELVVLDNDGLLRFFVATDDGVFYTDDGGQSWIALNDGISNYQLIAYDVIVDPATITKERTYQAVWRAGYGAVYSSFDGGDAWTDQTPDSIPNDWYDSPGPMSEDVEFFQLLFAGDRLFLLSRWQDGDGNWRSWLCYTDDAEDVRAGSTGQVTWTCVNTSWEEGS